MSLLGDEVNQQLTRLHRDIQDLRQENRELKDLLLLRAPPHHRRSKKTERELTQGVEDLIQNSNIQDYLKHGR